MLDPALCDRPPSQWLELKRMLSDWLTTPSLIILPLLALTILPWVIPRMPWKRPLSALGTVLLLAYHAAFFPPTLAIANQGLVSFIPTDSGATADAIVVLGRGQEMRKSRVEVVSQLWQAGRAPVIFASGRGDGPRIVQMLKIKGIPAQVLDNEQCSRTTEENARFTAAVLQPQGIKTILLVTDPPHMLRSLLTFRSLQFRVIPHVSPSSSSLDRQEKSLTVFYEYMGLLKYALQGRFLPRTSPELNQPQVGVLLQAGTFKSVG